MLKAATARPDTPRLSGPRAKQTTRRFSREYFMPAHCLPTAHALRTGLLLLLFCTGSALGAATLPQPSISVRYLEFPPYSFTNAAGEPEGSIITLTRRLLQQAGYRGEFRPAPSARLYAGLANGSINLWPGAPGVPQLKGKTLESRFQLAEVSLNLYYRAGTPAPQLPRDLQGRHLILLTGYTYRPPVSDWLGDPTLNLHSSRTSNHASALAMLAAGRGDYLIDYQSPIEREQKAQQLPPLPFISLHRLPIKLIFSKAAPGSERLRTALDQAYEQLQANGEDLSI